MPDSPSIRFFQVVSRSEPRGVTSPIPVTTTRSFMYFGSLLSRCKRGADALNEVYIWGEFPFGIVTVWQLRRILLVMVTVEIETHGCKLNTADSQQLAAEFYALVLQ